MIHRTSTLITTGSHVFFSSIHSILHSIRTLFSPVLREAADLPSTTRELLRRLLASGRLPLQSECAFHNYRVTHHSAKEAVSLSSV